MGLSIDGRLCCLVTGLVSVMVSIFVDMKHLSIVVWEIDWFRCDIAQGIWPFNFKDLIQFGLSKSWAKQNVGVGALRSASS